MKKYRHYLRPYKQELFMILSVFLFSLNDSLNKVFVSEIRPQEIIFWRSVFETGILLLYLALREPRKSYKHKFFGVLKTPYLKLHFLRVFLGLAAILIEIYSLKFLPLSSFAFVYAFNPIIIVVFSLLFLKEKTKQKIWLMIICGLLSAIMIPYMEDTVSFSGVEYAILAIILYSFNIVLTKKCTEDGAFRTIFFYASVSILPCLFACFFNLKASSLQIMYFFGQAFLHLAAFFALIKALSLGDLSRVAPLEYSDILWASLLGYLIFGEAPTAIFWIAACVLIFGKIVYFWKREKHV